MTYRHSLRSRITLSFFLFGSLLMVGVSTGVRFAIEDIEHRLLDESLRQEFDAFADSYRADPDGPLPRSATITAYLVQRGQEAQLPDFVRGLHAGIHEIDVDDRHLQAMLGDINGKRLVLVRDVTLFEQREDRIFNALTLAVLVASLLALVMGRAVSRAVIAPVTDLAGKVARLTPGGSERIGKDTYAEDEVGGLARAFDTYLERLERFIEREKAFTGDASHELRTPLTVIRGAVEILLADPALPAASRRVAQRIDRASAAMQNLVETLLLLARETPDAEPARCHLREVADAVGDEIRTLLGDKPVQLRLNISDAEVAAPEAVLRIVLGNLLRNAANHTRAGEIHVEGGAWGLRISDTGSGIDAADLPHVFERHFRADTAAAGGSGLGLSIVRRLCDRQGWGITIDSDGAVGTTVTLRFDGRETGPHRGPRPVPAGKT